METTHTFFGAPVLMEKPSSVVLGVVGPVEKTLRFLPVLFSSKHTPANLIQIPGLGRQFFLSSSPQPLDSLDKTRRNQRVSPGRPRRPSSEGTSKQQQDTTPPTAREKQNLPPSAITGLAQLYTKQPLSTTDKRCYRHVCMSERSTCILLKPMLDRGMWPHVVSPSSRGGQPTSLNGH